MDEAPVSHLWITQRHRSVALVFRGDTQPVFDSSVMVDCIHQKTIKTTPEAEGMGHERTVVEGNGTVEGRRAIPGFGMDQHHDRCVIEEAVFTLFHLLIGILHLRQGLAEIFQCPAARNQRQ